MESSPRSSGINGWFLCAIARAFIHVYRATISPILRHVGTTCLHYPTCSEYGLLAFSKYPFREALFITIARWRACNPFSGRPYIDYPVSEAELGAVAREREAARPR